MQVKAKDDNEDGTTRRLDEVHQGVFKGKNKLANALKVCHLLPKCSPIVLANLRLIFIVFLPFQYAFFFYT
jgi:hypothetical protein